MSLYHIFGFNRKRITVRHQIKVAKIGYFLAGFSIACWAPLIPYVKDVLSLNTIEVAKLVLCMGIGSICGMILSGILTEFLGCKLTFALSSFFTTLSLIILSFIPSYHVVTVTLVIFGISVGCLEVGINIYGAYLEKKYKLRLMSPLHAYYSLGEALGSALVIILLTLNLTPNFAITSLILILYFVAAYYVPCVLNIKGNKREKRSFAIPCYPVTYLALIVALTFIVGGAMIDWSGLYVSSIGNVDIKYAAFGYTLVSICMLICRIYGSKIIMSFGPFKTAFYGAIACASGLFLVVFFPYVITMFIGFCLIGLGMSNITPLSISTAAKQDKMPIVAAVSFISISGYTALLLGPALLGAVAQLFSLKGTFFLLGSFTVLSAILIFRIRRHYDH